ncbi:hypothetical protein N7466_011488 [Penicillium verhagenii]|uniref:uncharacterized protein n=1 Tax=Penicillium verhagenii TaxID=1562060 RepID=UPI002545211A|nr:uncharacterized protein N7466_011488 [Penicillium verhagenii]KAJ5915555.1 hypothetical protein N7466_011488 [Penicillium verhagenii]
MSSSSDPGSPQSSANILVVHGHGQSGQFISCKTQFLQEPLTKAIQESLHNNPAQQQVDTINFYHPTALFPANPDHPHPETNTSWAWACGGPEKDQASGYVETIRYLLGVVEEYGPFIGIVGFSTGAAIAAAITSILEKRESLDGVPFEITHPPLQFAVCFSGFRLEDEFYDCIYSPKIRTPVLHVMGNLDMMVEPARTKRLALSCANSSVYAFSGSHYIPRSDEFVRVLSEFVEKAVSGRMRCDSESEDGHDDGEDEWEDV